MMETRIKTSVLYRTVMYRQSMQEYIERSMESLILNHEYIDNIIILKNDKISYWDFSKLHNLLDGKVNIYEIEDHTSTNFSSFRLGVETFLKLPGAPRLLSLLDGDDAYLPGGLKVRVESKNSGVQNSRLDTIEYKQMKDSWVETGRTRSNYMPSFIQAARYKNSAFSTGLTITRRFIESVLLKAFERIEGVQIYDFIYEDFLLWSLAQLLNQADFVFEPTGIYRKFGFVRKEKRPEDASVREAICNSLTAIVIEFVMDALGKREIVKDTITGVMDISYSGVAVKF